VSLIAQSHEVDRDSGPSENGPVIININGNALNSYEVRKNQHDAVEVKVMDSEHLEQDLRSVNKEFDPAMGQLPKDGFQQEKNGDLSREEAEKQEVEEVKSKLRIYPIPAITELNIDMGKEVNADVTIMNIIGQDVYTETLEAVRKIQINVSDYPPGSYFVMIKLNGQLITKRVQIR
jgi:hypothetical protein